MNGDWKETIWFLNYSLEQQTGWGIACQILQEAAAAEVKVKDILVRDYLCLLLNSYSYVILDDSQMKRGIISRLQR